MRILGLTGSIGMGKSTAAAMFRRDGIAVHDADAAVHDLMRRGGAAVPAVAKAFPEAVRDGAVDRKALGALVFGKPDALRRLEAILHPLVRRRMRRFLQQAGRRGDTLVVLDIPLLFETGGERFCDAVAVVSAPRLLQRQRVLARPGMTREKFAAILAAQMPDREKRRRADWVVPTGLGRRPTRLALRAVRRQALARPGRRWRPSLKVM
ncbi:dephospho-CoA kinase [Inquilinus sp. NPDC058860]|uniref:dephospho-CoA kinase n=1 Tax=Inquilinus sp. NPDC058860 TaxID=3346652 RepID=UPI00368EC3F5